MDFPEGEKSALRRGGWVFVFALVVLLSACTSWRIRDGWFIQYEKGYRIALPPGGWRPEPSESADLFLVGPGGDRGMVATATCGDAVTRGPLEILAKRVLSGLWPREILEQGEVTVAGLPGRRLLLLATVADRRLKVATYTLRSGGCLYDLAAFAPATGFDAMAPIFVRFLQSFTLIERGVAP